MKKILSILTVFCSALVLSAGDAVPKGTYSNLLTNGKLELFAGTFPQGWRYVGTYGPGYSSDGGYNNGGKFTFTRKNVNITIRQDWTFSIIPGEKYRFRAKVRAKDFKAVAPVFMVVNNGWKQKVSFNIPQGTYDWQDVSFDFTGFESRGGYYSAVIRVSRQRSGSLEISDVIVEPATKSAYEKSTAYLKLIPEIKIVPIYPRRNFIPADAAKLHCRWFGKSDVKSLNYTVGNKKRKARIKNNLLTFDLSGLKTGSYTIKAACDKKSTTDIDVRIIPAIKVSKAKSLNNFHKVLTVKNVKANDKVAFGNPRNGWVYFTMPENMAVSVAGKELKNKQFIRLDPGNYDFKVLRGKGKVTVSAVTEVSLYAFATGPYFTNIPKQDWAFVKKYMLPWTMCFLGGENTASIIDELRSYGRRYFLSCKIAAINNAKIDSTEPIHSYGVDAKYKRADGSYIDELAMGSEKPLVYFLKNLPRLAIAPGRDVYTYICGNLQDSRFIGKVLSDSGNLTGHSYPLAEIYLPNRYTDEKLAQKLISDRLTSYAKRLNKILPGINPLFGYALCQSNMVLDFSVDHQPAADQRVFLDMQLHALANDPAFKDLGALNFWGGNYTDTERHCWLSAMFKHYVFEGKKTLLSKELGLKLVPEHVKNATFSEKLKYWKKSGSVAYGRDPVGGGNLKYFNSNIDSSNIAAFTKNKKAATLSQTLNNLIPGKKYRIRFVISGKGLLTLKVNNTPVDVRVSRIDKKRRRRVRHADTTALCDAFFTAKSKSEVMEFALGTAPAKSKTNLHFVSVFPCIDYDRVLKK